MIKLCCKSLQKSAGSGRYRSPLPPLCVLALGAHQRPTEVAAGALVVRLHGAKRLEEQN